MAERSEIVEQLIKISLDQNAQRQAQAGLKATRQGLEDVADAARDVNIVAPQIGSAIASDTDKATASVNKLAEAYDKVGKKAKEAGKSGGGSTGQAGALQRQLLGSAAGLGNLLSPGAGEGFAIAGQITALTKDFPKLKDVLSEIGPTALAAGAGIGAATLALSLIAAQSKKVQEAATAELNARASVIGFIQTASKEEIAAKIKELEQKQAINKAIADDANNVYHQLDQQTNVIGKINSALGTGAGELTAAREAADKANKSLGESSTELTLLQQALDAGVGATNDAIEAEKKLAEQRTGGILAGAQEAIDLEKKLFDEQKLNFKQIQDRIDAIGQESAALQSGIDYIKTSGDTSEAAAKKLAEYQVQQAQLGGELARLTDLKPIVMAREAEARAIEYQNKQLLETIDSVKQYNADVSDLTQKLDENGAKLAETLQQIIDSAAAAAQKALDKLNQKREEIATQFARDGQKADRDAAYKQIDIAIKEHEQELDLYKNYRRKLRDIQKQADEQSFSLSLDRNFSGLFDLNRQTVSAKNQAAQDESDAIDDAQEQRQRNLADLVRSLEVERNERQIAMQFQIADAIAAYQQEHQQIEIQRRDAEVKAKAAAAREAALLQQQLEARAAAEREQLQLIQQAEGQRLQITQQANAALIAQAQQLLAAFSGKSMTASGTSGTSSYSGGGGSLSSFSTMSSGALPTRLVSGSGSTSNVSSGGTTIQLTQNIQGGANAELIGEIASRKAIAVFKAVNGL
jgi:hypothetical protein